MGGPCRHRSYHQHLTEWLGINWPFTMVTVPVNPTLSGSQVSFPEVGATRSGSTAGLSLEPDRQENNGQTIGFPGGVPVVFKWRSNVAPFEPVSAYLDRESVALPRN